MPIKPFGTWKAGDPMEPTLLLILTLSVILAVVLLIAAIVSFVECRSRSRSQDTCWLLDKQLRLEEQALDAERKLLRAYYGQQKFRK